MKATFLILSFLLLLLPAFLSCEDTNDKPVALEIAVQDFIWKGLNTYYLWQNEVPDLADSRFETQDQLSSFLYSQITPEALFQNLLFKPVSKFPVAGEAVDRFSVLFSDYSELEGILSGTTLNTGMDYGLKRKTTSPTEIFGWVRYILPNSDAANKAIQRGAIFYAVNGIPLFDNSDTKQNNWNTLLNQNTSFTLNLADYDNGNITPNGQSVTLFKTTLSENPVFLSKVVAIGTHKIGYLVYNGFYPNYENQLNTAFGAFNAQGITDFVLDLRYNSGGSIATATRLASMITGQFTGQVFAKQQWNAKADAYFNATNPSQLYNYFTTSLGNGNGINYLSLNTLYVLTSKSTASASELVINGLKPYIRVVQIGDVTIGKNAGSVTLYDSPTFNKQGSNPDHKYAMQPLVLKTANKLGFGDYGSGLLPNIELKEDFLNLGILGEISEPLLNAAIDKIISGGRKPLIQPSKTFEDVLDTQTVHGFKNEMYLESLK